MPASQENAKLPEGGEIVITPVRAVSRHGAYVDLDEYGSMTRFLRISEIAARLIRDVERYVQPRQKTVLKVIRVDKAGGVLEKQNETINAREESTKSHQGLKI